MSVARRRLADLVSASWGHRAAGRSDDTATRRRADSVKLIPECERDLVGSPTCLANVTVAESGEYRPALTQVAPHQSRMRSDRSSRRMVRACCIPRASAPYGLGRNFVSAPVEYSPPRAG